jgi:hypothetical protein
MRRGRQAADDEDLVLFERRPETGVVSPVALLFLGSKAAAKYPLLAESAPPNLSLCFSALKFCSKRGVQFRRLEQQQIASSVVQ